MKLDSVHDLQTKLVNFMHKTNGIDANHLSLIDSLNTKVASLESDVTSIKSKMSSEDSSDSTTFSSDHDLITKL